MESWKGKLKELALLESGKSSAGPRFGDDQREQHHVPVDSEKTGCFSSLLLSAARHRRGELLCTLSTFLLEHFGRQDQSRILNALVTRPDENTLTGKQHIRSATSEITELMD